MLAARGGGAMREAYPLTWPDGWKRVSYRTRSRFEVSGFGKARDFLLAEIRRMGGTGVILSTNIPLRNDGLPYANSREPNDPGVAVYFRYGKREMCFACDAYVTVRENAYAIAKSIEALRGIERWGASDMMERAFRGFAALAATSQEDWWDVLDCRPDAGADTINAQYRARARGAHPDAGGSHEAMSRLNQARDSALATLQAVTQ
jgi:hypothetical protein